MSLRKSSQIGAVLSYRKSTECSVRNIEIEDRPPLLHTCMGVVKRVRQTLKTLIIAILEERIGLTEKINQACRVMPLTSKTGLEVSQFQLHHGKKSRTEIISIVKTTRLIHPTEQH